MYAVEKWHEELDELVRQIINTETSIISLLANEDERQAELRLASGRLLLKAKELVRSRGMKWEIEVVNLMPKKGDGISAIGKTCRTERMKVAKLPGVEKYTSLGWSKLVKIAGLVKPVGNDVVNDLFIKCKVSLEQVKVMDSERFSFIVDVCLTKKLLEKNRIMISAGLVEKALKKGVKFDDKLIKKLLKSRRPDTSLRALIGFDTLEIRSDAHMNPNAITTQLEEMIEKLIKTMQLALSTGAVPEHVPEYLYEDLAHYSGLMYYRK
ncbi:hypothetical protein [Fundidesulfovibrio agrisoli]|uniref:hypothetical protein n=1 Tax=Fundidesulfovibrio agrisoli TaxID=2922717 RepID=UPI001FACC419|nr:hypothetical protein [Fundidesulfovibrio agrisoli]